MNSRSPLNSASARRCSLTEPAKAARPAKATPKKTSFYQQEEGADRMRAAYLNTQLHTRYRSLSEFINAAIDEKVSALEKTYNGGQEWPPLAAREIPKASPSAADG